MYFRLILFLIVHIFSETSNAEQLQAVSDIQKEASALGLSQSKEWHVLNQVWRNIFGIQLSRIDEPEYFQSGTQYDVDQELVSFIEELVKREESDLGDKSIQCKFPARFWYVDSQLHLIERGIIKKADCHEFEVWKAGLDVSRVVLVFPAAYLNNPASMFGHTLLRLDSRAGVDNPLLSYAASFGAATGNDGGVAFAAKGLLGGYRASFTVEPYYKTVQRYGDIEHRDMWEYELLLTADELSKLVMGLWEYGHTYVDYYFFDENCSYYLLALLDTVRPRLGLSEKFSYWAIPSDTLKETLKVENILGKITYRASLSQKLEAQGEDLSNHQISEGIRIARGEMSPQGLPEGSDTEKAKTLEFAFDYLEYLNSSRSENTTGDRSQAQAILAERSALPTITDKTEKIEDKKSRPDETHESSRLMLGAGRKAGRGFYDVQIKPAYHDVLDSPLGFVKGAAIDFLNVGMRQYESDDFQLQFFNIVNVESYSPWTKVFSPKSWTVKFGYERKTVPRADSNDLEGSSAGFISGGYGITLEPINDLFISVLPGVKANYAPSFENHDYALAGGVTSKVSYHMRDDLRFLLSAEHMRYEIGEDHRSNFASFEANYDVANNVILRGGIQRQSSFSEYFNEFYLGLGLYF